MAIPDLVARIRLDTSGLSKGVAAVQGFGKAVAFQAQYAGLAVDDLATRIAKTTGPAAQGFNLIGKAGLAVGAGVAAGFGLAVHSAIQFESAFAGVRKTVDATAPELDDIRDGILEMARTMPAAATEIAAVAEAAGQLGVQKGAILDFTRTVIQLSETTNLTADEAATNLARFANIFQTPTDEIQNLGSALVDLGNKGASTESDILELGTRLAAAGKIAGLSEANVLSFANALSSVGVKAEAGGTAFAKVFTFINDAVIDGGDKLATFAIVAGQSAEDFAEAYRSDPASAIEEFVSGLGRITESGGSVTSILESLGLNGERTKQSLLSLAGAGDLLSDSIRNGNLAYQANVALVDEYNKRLETTGAKLEVARNNLSDLAIQLGDVFLPAIASAADGVASFLQSIGDLPGPLKLVGAGVTGMVGTVAGLGGAFLLLAPRINQARLAFQALERTAPRTASALGALGRIGAGAVGITALAVALGELAQIDDTDITGDIADLEKQFLRLGEAGNRAGQSIRGLDISGLGEAFKKGADVSEVERAISAFKDGPDAIGRFERAVDDADEAMSRLFDIDPAAAEDSFRALTSALKDQGVTQAQINDGFDNYLGKVSEAEVASRAAGTAVEDMAGNLENTAPSAEEAAAALKEFDEALDQILQETFSVSEATRNFEQAIDDLAASTFANTATLDLNTQAGRDNSAALQAMGEAGLGVIQASRELGVVGEDLNAVIAFQRQRFIDAATAAGFDKDQVRALADALFAVPKDVSTKVTLDGVGEARANLQSFIDKLKELPASHTVRLQIEELQADKRNLRLLPARQFGGAVFRGTPYVVGEQGPEVFVPDISGRILPNGRTAAAASTVQNSNRTYNQQVVVNEHVSPRRVVEELDWFNRTSGV